MTCHLLPFFALPLLCFSYTQTLPHNISIIITSHHITSSTSPHITLPPDLITHPPPSLSHHPHKPFLTTHLSPTSFPTSLFITLLSHLPPYHATHSHTPFLSQTEEGDVPDLESTRIHPRSAPHPLRYQGNLSVI